MDFLAGDWAQLNHLQLGRYAEQLVTMGFVAHGLEVYRGEVDDRGIDLILRTNERSFWEIQVKSVRNRNHVFFPKNKFRLHPSLWGAVVHFLDNTPPTVYLIPSETWRSPEPPFASRDFPGGRAKPEWSVSLAKKYDRALSEYRFTDQVSKLR